MLRLILASLRNSYAVLLDGLNFATESSELEATGLPLLSPVGNPFDTDRIKKSRAIRSTALAAKAIETGGKISQSQAKETFARTLREELGEEKARPLI